MLLDARKHWRERYGSAPPVRLDEASSGRWFMGWRRSLRAPMGADGGREVALARSWMLKTGWRRHGLVDPGEVPGSSRR